MPVNVAIIGVGLVGGEVISQLSLPALAPLFTIVALSNSKHTLLTSQGISSSTWKSALSSAPAALALPELTSELSKIAQSTGRHTVVIDNTSNDAVASHYPAFLKAGLSVVTPNKKATSSSLDLYRSILASSAPSVPSGPLYYGESTVGAGLPILSTLKDLVATGDEVHKIEGVFSGTLSYIFNEFSPVKEENGAKTFSEIVKGAREAGYTEPHPADDLSGVDVARKLAILSRLVPALASSLPNGCASVDTRSLIPSGLEDAKTGDDFVTRLPQYDAQFEELKEQAKKEGSVLRYVGVIDVQKGAVRANLEKYPATHPFATSLSGSDNIIAFHTARYSARPLIIQGAGAGAAVTAMGVVGDALKVAERRG